MKYVKVGAHYEVFDEAGELVCYVRKKRMRVWTAWATTGARERTAGTMRDAAKLAIEGRDSK
jgi:hypothetical protein